MYCSFMNDHYSYFCVLIFAFTVFSKSSEYYCCFFLSNFRTLFQRFYSLKVQVCTVPTEETVRDNEVLPCSITLRSIRITFKGCPKIHQQSGQQHKAINIISCCCEHSPVTHNATTDATIHTQPRRTFSAILK